MKKIDKTILAIYENTFLFFNKAITLIFSLGVLVPIVFLSGITVILITVYSISIIAFGFTLGGVLILLSFLLLQMQVN
ncbi:hypothetical protein [Corticicoccus populi]|uniref:Uncharacterized protein n=1 Tax=Corticicoccus populi TaxID=1812821 RepID=A0ABW5WTH3_9STAP